MEFPACLAWLAWWVVECIGRVRVGLQVPQRGLMLVDVPLSTQLVQV